MRHNTCGPGCVRSSARVNSATSTRIHPDCASDMDNLDFTAPPPKQTFDTRVALKYFKASGSPLDVAAGTMLFAEGDKAAALLFQRDRMYFVVEGEVELTVKHAHVGKACAASS